MSRQSKAPSKLLIVDGANAIYRAFFGIPLLRSPSGVPSNATLGFVNMLLKVIRDETPDGVVVVFDPPGKTFRHEMYPEYKSGRDAMPEDLREQFPWVRRWIEAQRIPIVEVPGYEADDVIASLVACMPDASEVSIVSSDKDLMQLVTDTVVLLDGMRDRRYDPAAVKERFGVEPGQVLDLRALVGDPSDNIPGVKGIGAKGAAKLIEEWGDLDGVLANAEKVKAKRAREALLEQREAALLSRELSTLVGDVTLPLALDALGRQEPDTAALRELYRELDFSRLLDGLEDGGDEAEACEAAPRDIALEMIASEAEMAALVKQLGALPCVSLHLVFAEAGPLRAEPVGAAFECGDGRAAYVPLGESAGAEASLGVATFVDALAPLIGEGGSLAWISADAKHVQMLFAEHGVTLSVPHFDATLAGQLLDPSGARSLAAISKSASGPALRTWEELAGRGAKAIAAAELPRADVARFAAETACGVAALRSPLEQQLDAAALTPLFEAVELPLTRVLARMERNGVRIDEEKLAELSVEYETQLATIVSDVYRLAGEEFLISSPKQLQRILFEKLELPPSKKTKTGYSTDEEVLEHLSTQHELPGLVLSHRRLSKLKSTYIDALPPLVNPRTGRIHPTFNQLGAATGRMSATHPNVQNIPIRTPEGVRIREAFVPAEGRVLLSADYSQVELRILAHYSGDASLIDAFEQGEDIHRRTAAEVAGIAPGDVDDEQRARAKAVNFGIIYGSSAFGLARQLGIASGEAQETIDAYFARYQGVRRFLDETIANAKQAGFVTTFLGRRRNLPDLASRNRTLRQAAERMAVNTVIQGTAADLIKKAMVEVDAALAAGGPAAAMILQVHDELVFEVEPGQVDVLTELLRERMQDVLGMKVPLVIDVGVGANWREAH